MNKVAARLFGYIHDRNITQKDAAKMLAVSENTMTGWKQGKGVDAKNAEAILKFTAGWNPEPQACAADDVTAAILDAVAGLSLVDRCRVLAFAADLAGEKRVPTAPPPAPAPEPAPEPRIVRPPMDRSTVAVCPHCGSSLYGGYEPGVKFSCPECGQHITIHDIPKKSEE